MDRRKFMNEFEKRLSRLPTDEVREAVDYYEQYFADAGVENEKAVLAELGSPAGVASQIIAGYAVKGADMDKSVKSGLSTVWLVVLAVFASPIALPIAAAIFVVALALVIVLLSVVISIGAAGFGLAVGGVVFVAIGVIVFIQSFATGIYALGAGLVCASIGMALLVAAVTLTKKCFTWLAKSVGNFILRRKKK